MSGLQYIERYMAKIEQKSGKILTFYKNRVISKTLKTIFLKLGKNSNFRPKNSNFCSKIRIFGQKIRIFKNPRVIYPEILQGTSGPNFSSNGRP